ncbi:hypothetical protein [Flavobacterium lindanitolerans]|uniref:hypothetical protein n=1 Tax=Flavobacterium lindanitolerans TaxID=428988 RepID=UPI0031D5F3DC
MKNWRTIYSDGIIYNGQIEYGAYIRHIPPYTELPSGLRVPNPIDYRNLINSLGNNAFAVLTDPNGFSAKPYGYIRKTDGPVAQPNLEDFNNKAYFATTDDGTTVMCLVVDFTTQTVYMKYLPSRTYLGGFGSFYINYYYPIRLMKG